MKKLKVFMLVALFGAMSFGAFSAYDYVTMSAEERTLLENVEALTSNEGGSGLCYQTMSYCGAGGINLTCSSSHTGTRCTQYVLGCYFCN